MKHAFLWGIVLALAAVPVTATTLSFSAAPATVREGGTVLLDVVVTEVDDLFAFQFDVGFDPSIVQAGEVLEGGFLNASGAATSFVPGIVDNVAGTVSFTANTLLGPASGATGAGTLVRLSFQALAPGHSELVFGNVVLLDSALAEIAVAPIDGVINVSAVPEPASAVLAAIGLVVLAAAARHPRGR